MINAPQVVIDALKSKNFSYANLITINLGDAYDIGTDVILYLTDYAHPLSFGGNDYLIDHNLTEIDGISRKASTGSDKVDIVFSVTNENLIDVIKSERYINKKTSIDRVVIQDGAIVGDFSIPVRTAWGLSHSINGDTKDRSITLTIDSVLGDLEGDNGWYAVNASHERRYAGDKIMKHSGTVMTEDQQNKYTANFDGVINQQIKPPALSKVYGYKNVDLVPICMLKHRKTHTSYRHYFTTLIYAINIGDCQSVDLKNLRKGDEAFDFTIVSNTARDVGGWSCRIRTPDDAANSSILAEEQQDLSFWFEGMDSSEKARMQSMVGKGLTLLFFKNRNRDDWLQTAPKLTVPVYGSPVYDPRSGQTVYSRNPALQYADFLRSTEYGAGNRNIPVVDSNISELADHFDQIPDSIGNDGINSILIDVQVDTGNPLVDNMNIWMEGVRLYTSDYYGEFNVRVETKASVDLVINEDDLIGFPDYDSGEFTDRLNQLTYTIKQLVPDTSDDAEAGDLVEVDVEATFPEDGSQFRTDWLAEDGGIQNFDSEQLDYVTELEQAYYWAMVDARISRLPRTLELPIGAIGWLTEVGDVIEYSSDVMSMSDVLWRVEEVSEDEGEVILSLKAYDDTFYTPDPDSIPAPVAPAQPPTKNALSPVAGMAITIKGDLYYLDWTPLSSSNVAWYAVEIYDTSDESLVYDDPKVAQPPYLLDSLVVGDYRAVVVAVSFGGEEGAESVLEFSIDAPQAPTVTVTPNDLDAQLVCSTTNDPVGQKFELEFGISNNQNTANNLGYSSGSFTVTGLSSGTNYFYWVRTITPVGISNWTAGSFTTTADGSAITDLIGEDIANQILPDVIDAVNDDLQETVDNSLVDYSTTVETQTLIDDSLSAVGAIDTEDNRVGIVDTINNIFDNYDTEGNVKTETLERKTELSQLQTDIDGNVATISSVSQAVSDLDSATASQFETVNASVSQNASDVSTVSQALATETETRATQVTELNAKTENNAASIVQTNSALASETEARTDQINQLSSTVGDNTAAITSVNSALVTESETRASAVTQLQSDDQAIISDLNAVTSDVEGNAEAISAVEGIVENPTTGLNATYSLAQSAKSTADGAVQSNTQLTNTVEDPSTGLSATNQLAQTAKSTADGNTDAVNSLTAEVEDPNTGLNATNQLAQSSKIASDAGTVVLEQEYSGAESQIFTNTISKTFSSGYNYGEGFISLELRDAKSNNLDYIKFNGTNLDLTDAYTNANETKWISLPVTIINGNNTVAIKGKSSTDAFNVFNIVVTKGGVGAPSEASAITKLSSEVSDADGKAESALTLVTSVDESLDGYRATAQLAVNADGSVAFIQLDATPEVSQIKFKGDQIFFLDENDVPVVYWDTSAKRYIFEGSLLVGSSIKSPTIEFVGDGYMQITSAVGFGANNEFIEWYGIKYLTGGEIDYTKVTKSNAITYKTVDGDAYFGGSLSAGILRNAATTTLIDYTINDAAVEIGEFGTNGNVKNIVISWAMTAGSVQVGSCSAYQEPSLTWRLERKIGSGSWQQLTSGVFTGYLSLDETGGECTSAEGANTSTTYVDNNTSIENFQYRVVVTQQLRYHSGGNVGSQKLTLVSTEE